MSDLGSTQRSASFTADRHGLRGLVLRGIAWTMGAVVSMQASRVIVTVILARLLTPHEFGIAAMVLVFSTLVLAFSDLALGSALVQRPNVTEQDKSTIFWTSVAVGTLLMVAGMLLAGPLAAFYGEPRVKTMFIAVSVGFFVLSLQTTQASLLQRGLQFRILTLRRIAAVVISGCVGIVAALSGAGAWSLIAQQLVMGAVSTVLLWTLSDWRPRFVYSTRSLRDLGGFGLNVLGARLFQYLTGNADNLLVGKYLGSSALGFYSVAYNVVILPLRRIVDPIQAVLFPAYSRWQEDRDDVGKLWLRANRTSAAILIPSMVGLIVIAPDFVRVLLGEKWVGMVTVLQVLAVVGLLHSLVGVASKVLEAVNKPRLTFWLALVQFAVTLPAFVLGLRWGITGVAVCYAVVTAPIGVLNFLVAARAVDISLPRVVAAFAGVVQAAAVMAAAVWLVRKGLVDAGIGAPVRLPLLVITGLAVYVPLCAWRAPQLRNEVARLRVHRRGTRAAAVA